MGSILTAMAAPEPEGLAGAFSCFSSRINAHRIALGENQESYSADTKLSTDYDFFRMLHDGGRRAAQHFLDEHFEDIGRRSTFDLRAKAQAEWA